MYSQGCGGSSPFFGTKIRRVSLYKFVPTIDAWKYCRAVFLADNQVKAHAVILNSMDPTRIPPKLEVTGLHLNNAGRMTLHGRVDRIDLQKFRNEHRIQAQDAR